MATRARAGHLKLDVDRQWMVKVCDKINPVLEQAAKGIEADAKAKAPYDEKSRRASGKRSKTDNFPVTHHRDAIYHGQVDESKRRKKAAEVALFFDTMPGKLKSYFVRSRSGRGWWLEEGTKGLGAGQSMSGENYMALIDQEKSKKGRSRAAKLILRQLREIRGGGRPHYATPKQPHFSPAFRKWAKWVGQKIAHIV